MSTGRCGGALVSGDAALVEMCNVVCDVVGMGLTPKRIIYQILEHAGVAINGVIAAMHSKLFQVNLATKNAESRRRICLKSYYFNSN